MKTVLVVLAVLSVALAIYVVWLRPYMKTTSWGKQFLDSIEPMERRLWWKSETMLWVRFKVLLGSALTVLVGVDWNSVSPLFPEKYRPLLLALPTIFIAIDGLMGEKMRRDTSKPLEIVAMRTDAPAEVKQAAAQVAVATAEVVETVKATEAV